MRPRPWWILAFFGVMLVVFGVTDLANGVQADPGITLAIAGMSPDEVRAANPVGYRLFDFATRGLGLALVFVGSLLTLVVAGPYRDGLRWAWLAMWTFPAWAVGVPLLYLGFGVAADQPPAPPMVSGPVLALIAAATLIVDARRFSASRPALVQAPA